MDLRSFAKTTLRKYGYDLVPYLQQPEPSIDVFTLAVSERVGRGAPCVFMEVGANDGVRHDPLRDSILKHKLRGIFIEPIPELFQKLQANYAGHPDLIFENCAIGPVDGTATLYRFRPDPSLPDFASELASFNREHLAKKSFGIKDPEKFIESVEIQSRTMASILARHGNLRINVLQIDTEGYDFEIIKAALSAGMLPEIVHYENAHLSRQDRRACCEQLVAKGYGFMDLGTDSIAILKE